MKKGLFVLLITGLLIFTDKLHAQSSASTLDVVSWNLEWFGDTFGNGPANKDLQEANVKKIMRVLDADLYGLCEIVDSMRVRRLVDSLGNTEYGFVISPFCSSNTTGTGASWLNGQKLAFIYRKSIFSNVTTRGLMRSSSNAYTNWASGRFPFMLSATVTINSISKNMNFIVIHGKSGSTASDYQRRQGGAQELKDTLDAKFSTTNNFIIGDFNDALNTSIYAGAGGVSSFISIVADSTDADHYKSITLPLGNAGQTSMTDFPNVIDNHVISNELEEYYVPGSVKIRTDVTTIIPDYITAHNTSDHYPVFSKYNLTGAVTSVPNISASELGIITFPNPFAGEINIRAMKTLTQVQLKLINMQGQVLSEQQINRIIEGATIQPHFPLLSKGIYFLQVQTKQYKTVVKLVHL
jgi:hypothetical protein